jgi:hypothetical protein
MLRKYSVPIFFLFLGLACFVATGVLTLQGLITEKFISNALRLLLSWPVIFLITVTSIMGRFGDSIDGLIKRISSVSWKDARFQMQPDLQKTDENSVSIPDEELARLAENTDEDVEKEFEEDNYQLTGDDLERLRSFLKSKEEEHQERYANLFKEMLWWQFRYLDLILVPFSKMVFIAFVRGVIASRADYFRLYWPQGTPNPDDPVLNVLSAHNLVHESGGIIAVTPRGIAYARHLIEHKEI